jgi:hypothetical protein
MSHGPIAPTNVKSYLWSFPGCPLQIHLSFDLIERIRSEVLELAPADREVGGLLLGNASPDSADVHVSDYFLVPPGSGAGPYLICSNGLAHALSSCSATERQVVGYFRTHLAPRVQLRSEELDCIRQSFQDSKNVFLVIRVHEGHASGGFFFWQDGRVFGDSTLTFPFSVTELNKPAWNTLVGGSPAESRMSSAVKQARQTMSLGAHRVGLALFAVAVLFAVVIFAGRGLFTGQDGSGALGLRARRTGLSVEVSWNASNPKLADAKEANLLIWDGPGQPMFLPLTRDQLRSGRMLVTSVNDKVGIRLDVIADSGEAKIESISLSPQASAPPPEPVARQEPPVKAEAGARPAPAAPPKWKIFNDLSEPRSKKPRVSRDAAPPVLHTLDRAAGGPTRAAEPITETQPAVPPDLRARISSDNVIGVRVEINAAGKVVGAKLASEKGAVADSLASLAVGAAWHWRFRPATENGKQVRSEKTIEFLFRPPSR